MLEALHARGIQIEQDVHERSALPILPVSVPRASRTKARDPLQIVLRDPRVAQLLTAQEEVDLGRAIALGARAELAHPAGGAYGAAMRDAIKRGERARERMIVSNTKLVLGVAHHYRHFCDMTLEDLFQEGVCGLIRAVEKFDHTKGFKFSTYATWWIRQAITRAIADKGQSVRFPVHVFERVAKLKRARRVLTRMSGGREPSLRELVDELGWTPEKVQFFSQLSQFMSISLDAPLAEDGEATRLDILPSREPGPDDLAQVAELEIAVQAVLRDLPAREKDIIQRRFGIPNDLDMTLEEIGALYDRTRERIRQIESKGLAKLRHPKRMGILADFWVENAAPKRPPAESKEPRLTENSNE